MKKDIDFLKRQLSDFKFLGFIPYDDQLIEADLSGISPYDINSKARSKVGQIIEILYEKEPGKKGAV